MKSTFLLYKVGTLPIELEIVKLSHTKVPTYLSFNFIVKRKNASSK